MTDALTRYVRHGHTEVKGWLTPLAAGLIAELGKCQGRLKVAGPVCEIGVHHGRLFILLHLLTAPGELSVAWDLFERQKENVDQSGAGNRAIVAGNLARHGGDPEQVRLHTANSLDLTPAGILEDCSGRPRLFSIDGGHTAELTRHDLELAAATICPGGLIILDDFFNEAWPGVAEGVCSFFSGSQPGLVPVAIFGNKFVLTNDADLAREYRKAINEEGSWIERKNSVVFGGEVLILSAVPRTMKNVFARTPVGGAIRRMLWR